MLAMSIRRVSAALHLLDGGRHTLAATRGSIPARTHRHHGICPVRRLRGHAARERPSAAADEVGAGEEADASKSGHQVHHRWFPSWVRLERGDRAGPGGLVARLPGPPLGIPRPFEPGVLDRRAGRSRVAGTLLWLGVMNGTLAVFNLIPGSPLDGGRVLHAILWRLRGDRTRAALTAARVGQGVGAILIGLGVLGFVLAGNAGGLWTALVGWFVLGAARGEAQVAALRIGLGDSRVRDVMRTQPVVGPAWVTVDALRRVPPERRALLRVGQVALPLERAITVTPDASAVEVAARLAMTRQTLALVLDEGRLVGVVSPPHLSRAIALGQSFPRGRGAGPFGPVAQPTAPPPANAPPAPPPPQGAAPAPAGWSPQAGPAPQGGPAGRGGPAVPRPGSRET